MVARGVVLWWSGVPRAAPSRCRSSSTSISGRWYGLSFYNIRITRLTSDAGYCARASYRDQKRGHMISHRLVLSALWTAVSYVGEFKREICL